MPVGAEAVPLPVNPNVVEPPGERLPLYEAFLTDTVPLVPLFVPFHNWVIVCPLARVSLTVQPLIADEPAVTVTVPWKPPGQLLTCV